MAKIFYPKMKQYIILHPEMSYHELYEQCVTKFDYPNEYDSFRRLAYQIRKNDSYEIREMEDVIKYDESTMKNQVENDLMNILKEGKHQKFDELCQTLCCSESALREEIDWQRKNKGHEILITPDNRVIWSKCSTAKVKNVSLNGTTEIIFGIASDLHFGSRACQITRLHEFAEICRKKGVKDILVPGDIVDGRNVYKGQEMEVYEYSAEGQEASVINNLPEGFNWKFLGGNHDHSFVRTSGHDPLKFIASHRKDVQFIGYDMADVEILPGVTARLWHPSGGVPYAYSYNLQKAATQIAYEQQQTLARGIKDFPYIRFLLSGHLHVTMTIPLGGLLALHCGTFQGNTSYLKRKCIFPNIGGWIVWAELGEYGVLKNYLPKFYFFEEIKDDWKNYDHSMKEEPIVKPLFSKRR